MCENIKVNVVNLYPDDVIIAHLNANISVDETRQIYQELSELFPNNENIGPDEVHEIYQALNKLFPNNTVNVINNYFIKEFTIFSDHDQNPFLRGAL